MCRLLKYLLFLLIALPILYLPACSSYNSAYYNEPTAEKKTKVAPTAAESEQKQKTPPPDTSGQLLIYEVADSMAVDNGVTADAVFTVTDAWLITQIITYHWNGATGAEPGTIALQANDGTLFGPWQASGSPGQNNVQNAYWNVYPNEVIPKGTYTILDSDPYSWSSNFNTAGVGMVYVYGKEQ